MVFNSVGFLLFFAAVLLLDRLPLPWPVRKLNLLAASLLFYAAWYPPALLLLLAILSIGYVAALAIAGTQDRSRRRTYLALNLLASFGALAYFKYAGFLWANSAAVAQALGLSFAEAPSVLLPLGISFYTFQVASYVIDVYRGRSQPARSYGDFALYVSFFPQLVAGPIVRFDDLYPQLREPKRATREQFSGGVLLLIFGLFLKVTLGDAIFAPVVEAVYGAAGNPAAHVESTSAWAGIFGFAGQLYCDFAGYSLCAVGLASCLGIALPWNFNRPYGATSFSEFWTRWHISLSSWIRDYVYYPLGGNRRGPVRTAANLMVAFVLSGFWHGAAWTFGVWGAIHGAILVLEKGVAATPLRHAFHYVPGAIKAFTVLSVFALSLVFFRAQNLDQAVLLLQRAFAGDWFVAPFGGVLFPWQIQLCLGVMAAVFLFHYLLRNRSPIDIFGGLPVLAKSAIAAAPIVLMLTTLPEKGHVFIYFQF